MKPNKRMNGITSIVAGLLFAFTSMSLVIRHDVSDRECIELAKDYPQICHLDGGQATIISENWLVSAAHVAIFLKQELENGESPEAWIGDEKLTVKKVIIHPDYLFTRSEIENDIALIQIEQSITSVPLPKLYDRQDEMGKHITIVGRGGYGTGLTGPESSDKITRAATNRIDGVLEQWITFDFDSPESHDATKYEAVSGPGDSGGPAFIDIGNDRFLIGVSSNQRSHGKQGIYGAVEYYTRISNYIEWLEAEMK